MVDKERLKPMSDIGFRAMVWIFKLVDLFGGPGIYLLKVPLKQGMTVVDYGCGPGRYTIPMAKLVGPEGKVFAVDIQPLAINMVKELAEHEDLVNIEVALVDSYSTGIEDSTADLLLLNDTLHMIEDCNKLLREIHRVLKHDGILFMNPGHMKLSKAIEIVESSNIFTIVECKGVDMIVTPKIPY